MSQRRPPSLAIWLLSRLPPGSHRESLIGDLIERHQNGRSTGWFWRQTIGVILGNARLAAWSQKWAGLIVIATNVVLPFLYVSFVVRWVMFVNHLWYQPLMQWSLETPGSVFFRTLYGVGFGLSDQLAWCLILALLTRTVVRLQPEARRSVAALFLLFQFGQSIPGLRHTFTGWLHHPGDLSGSLLTVRFAFFAFVAMPFSIVWGARASHDTRTA